MLWGLVPGNLVRVHGIMDSVTYQDKVFNAGVPIIVPPVGLFKKKKKIYIYIISE